MDLREYLRLLRRRWRLIAVLALVGIGLSVVKIETTTPIFTARTQLFVAAQDAASSDINAAYTGGLFTQQRVKSYADVAHSVRVAGMVVDDLGLKDSPSKISKQISTSVPIDTVLINAAVRDADPKRAAAIADSLGRQVSALVADLERPESGGPAPVRVSVVQPPQIPSIPTSPRKKFDLVLGFLLGALLGVFTSVVREVLDTSVKTPDVAEALARAPMLGAISFDPDSGKNPLVVHTQPNSTRAEAFRQLRTNLQFVDIEHPLRSVVVTSSVPAEGKSTTTCNLAITLAQAGIRTVLVEGDLRRPRIADYMGIEGAVGLTSVLLGRVSLDDALQPWGDGPLKVLPGGPLPPNPSELLGSAGMEALLHDLEERADVVLIDAPPLLPVTDAAVLGASTSGVLLVVRSGKTRREQLQRAQATLEAVGSTVLGVLLNMVPTKGPDAYAYGYGYGYGAYSSNRPTQVPLSPRLEGRRSGGRATTLESGGPAAANPAAGASGGDAAPVGEVPYFNPSPGAGAITEPPTH